MFKGVYKNYYTSKGIYFFYKYMYGLALVKTLKFKPANKNKYVRMG